MCLAFPAAKTVRRLSIVGPQDDCPLTFEERKP